MKEFVFAEYVKEIKSALKKSRANETLISELYGLIALPAALDGKNGVTIDCAKTTAHNIIHRKANVHQDIQAHSQDPIVVDGVGERYKAKFGNLFHDSKLPHCLDAIREAVEDADMHDDRKQFLLSKFSKQTPWDFLGLVLLEVVIVENKREGGSETLNPNGSDNETRLSHCFPKRPHVESPEEASHEEGKFIAALLDAYGEAEAHECFCIEDLPSYPKRQRDFNSQRESYYVAEEVRRGARDIYSEYEPDQFEVFKDEVFRGIEMVYYDEHDSGVARLREVLSQAVQTSIQKSWLGRDTDWIGPLEKRGACHFLVNDGILPGWVDVDG